MVIVMPRWALDIANVDTTDASSMGVVMAVYLKTRIGTLMIISTYWRCKVSKQKAAERIESLADEVTKETQEINLVINDKPPSKAFKKIGPDVKRAELEVKAAKKSSRGARA